MMSKAPANSPAPRAFRAPPSFSLHAAMSMFCKVSCCETCGVTPRARACAAIRPPARTPLTHSTHNHPSPPRLYHGARSAQNALPSASDTAPHTAVRTPHTAAHHTRLPPRRAAGARSVVSRRQRPRALYRAITVGGAALRLVSTIEQVPERLEVGRTARDRCSVACIS